MSQEDFRERFTEAASAEVVGSALELGRERVREALDHPRGFAFAARLLYAEADATADQFLPRAEQAVERRDYDDPGLSEWNRHADVADAWSLIRDCDPELIEAILDSRT